MRIATRLWLVLLVGIAIVLGVGVAVRVQQEQRLLLDVTQRDRRFFAHVLQGAIARGHDPAERLAQASAVLDREEIADAHIVARLVSPTARGGLPRPELPASQTEPLARGEIVVGVRDNEILTYVPLEPDGGVVIELAEEHAVAELLERIGWWSLASQTLALAALAAVVTFALVRWQVGRPLERLALLARRIGAGDLAARADLPPARDEVGILAREMDNMAERLEATRKALEETDAERVAALEQLRHADRLRTVGQLASALAHELGTPLNVVAGHARMIEEEVAAPSDARSSARTILEQSSRMTRIIRQLLDFARRKGAHVEARELGELAQNAAETMAPLARRYRARVDVERVAGPVPVRADAQQILQVLTNLLTNAMQAMPTGGRVRIVVDEIDATPPTGVHAPTGRYARVAVIDEGTGIDANDLPHLFEAFFTKKPEGEGTGLGLAVVEGIVREHRGWIAVQSEVGKGSRFEVFLPVRGPSGANLP